MRMDIGGVETHILELSKELRRRGHDITVVSFGGVFEKELNENGIKHLTLPLHNKRPANLIASYKGLKEIIKNGSFDLVHCHARIPAFLCGLLQRKMKFRFVTSAHWVFKVDFMLKMLTDWGEKTMAVSNDIRKYLMDNYKVPLKNIYTTINGIDTEKFSSDIDYSEIAGEFSFGSGKTRIVYISRIDLDRSAVAFNLLNVTKKLYEKNKKIEIVIVGGGNDYDRLKARADEINKELGERVVITTGSRADINKFISGADIFIGVSRAVLEAMSAAKPVIIAGNEGFIGLLTEKNYNTAVQTNFCCRGCEMASDDLLYKDLKKLLAMKDDERKKIGSRNRSVILESYSVKIMADDHIKLYNDILEYNPYKYDKIVLSGYYGFNNSGDDAILKMILSGLKSGSSGAGVTVLSNKPAEVRRLFKVNSVSRWNIFKIFKAIKHAELFISGGGSVIQDVTSTKSLLYYLSLIMLAKSKNKKVMLYANGIGPVNKPFNKRLTKNVLNKVDLITLREDDSEHVLNELGVVKPKISVTCDPVIGISDIDDDAAEDLLYRYNVLGRKFVLVSLRDWKEIPSFDFSFAEALKQFKQKHSCELVFLPLQYPTDVEINKKYAKITNSVCVNKRLSAEMCVSIAKKSEFAISMRLHLIIYAFTAGVPSIGINYDPKIESVMKFFGQETFLGILEFTTMNFLAKADRLITNKEIYKNAIEDRLADLKTVNKKNIEMAIELLEN